MEGMSYLRMPRSGEMVPWTLRIEYDSSKTYQKYAHSIERLVETKYGAYGATNFQIRPPQPQLPVSQYAKFEAPDSAADMNAIKLGDGITTKLYFNDNGPLY